MQPPNARSSEGFRGLRVWQEAVQLSVDVSALALPLERGPQAGLADQLRRAATSVHANIAEGYGRRTVGDRSRFYTIAWASLLEVETLLTQLARVRPVRRDTAGACLTRARHVARLLAAYRRSITHL
jgi:four helix bundle protein